MKLKSVKMTPEQIALGKAFRENMENNEVVDSIYGMAAALDQYRSDYVLPPGDSIKIQKAIVGLMTAAIA
jgi:hypothetical protein